MPRIILNRFFQFIVYIREIRFDKQTAAVRSSESLQLAEASMQFAKWRPRDRKMFSLKLHCVHWQRSDKERIPYSRGLLRGTFSGPS